MTTSRRTFLKTSAAAVLGFPAILRAASPNSNLQVAVVGCAGMGFFDMTQIGSHPRVKLAGLCDVDTARFEKADQKFPGIPHFQDFREMFAKLGDSFDAVQVSTPDHMHAFVALDAMRRGKHVYCQKPLTHTVWEARQMRLQAAKSKVVTQMGNQIHSASEYRTAVRLVRDGAIGKIKEVHSWQKNNGNGYTKLTAPPAPGPVPASLNWDGWIGAAPLRDYAPGVYHPFNWRDWQDFGGGTMGDFGCHILDPVFTALELTAPLSIRAENEGLNPHSWPSAETIRFVFPGTAFTLDKTLPLTWHDGGRQPDRSLAQMPADKKLPGSGSLLIGEGGVLIIPHVAMPQLYPEEKFSASEMVKEPKANHYHAWVDAALAGTSTTDSFEYAGSLTEAVQLGNVATRLPGVTLEWDSAAMRIPNSREAEALLTKEYRAGWKIAAVGESG
ncbi:MAG: Gfo/Idh/MocA family oxidoreductase [Verrucomicrobiota bacterium]|nr:Gfo/Idh/MocA family oxidoreductase [Verrucomicrobiota bacterium]